MLISRAAAGMAAVFRAPLTGLIFALEMPYRDDLAHEALLPSLIASVVSYATLVALLGSEPLFGFVGSTRFSERDLFWSALRGVVCGLAAMVFCDDVPPLSQLRYQAGRAAYLENGCRRNRNGSVRAYIRYPVSRGSADAAGAQL